MIDKLKLTHFIAAIGTTAFAFEEMLKMRYINGTLTETHMTKEYFIEWMQTHPLATKELVKSGALADMIFAEVEGTKQ